MVSQSHVENVNFNSIKVQLIIAEPRRFDQMSLPFQFHKGTINTCARGTHEQCERDFNSIKVQLIHRGSQARRHLCGFQFHKGTINIGAVVTSCAAFRISIP